MKPSARLQAVVELLDEFQSSNLPLDILSGNYFRKRRFIGSGDRRAVKETLYGLMRQYISLGWVLGNAGLEATPRWLLLAYLSETGGLEDELFAGDKYGLPALSDEESKGLEKLDMAGAPAWARLNCPEWLAEKFKEHFGDGLEQELEALNQRAPLCLRVNTLKTSVEKAAPVLEGKGFIKTKLAAKGFSSPENIPLHDLPGFQDGHYEVQDEGSQLAASLVGAEPGQQVLDLCAGAGGKTLAMAADMQNKGQVFAYDTDERRLTALQKRIQKAGVRNVQVIAKDDLKGLTGKMAKKMDRVLLDVPCSGTGTWRRSPDSRIRLTPEKLEGYLKTQAELLDQGAGYVKPGGKMAYVSCSLLSEENEDQVSAFLGRHKGWQLLKIDGDFENNATGLEGTLQLTPARHGTDGFFVAILHNAVT